jgi:hypothetical protein
MMPGSNPMDLLQMQQMQQMQQMFQNMGQKWERWLIDLYSVLFIVNDSKVFFLDFIQLRLITYFSLKAKITKKERSALKWIFGCVGNYLWGY